MVDIEGYHNIPGLERTSLWWWGQYRDKVLKKVAQGH